MKKKELGYAIILILQPEQSIKKSRTLFLSREKEIILSIESERGKGSEKFQDPLTHFEALEFSLTNFSGVVRKG